jgi:hypothetical protein
VHLGKEVLLDSLGLDAIGVTFCAHLPKGVLKSRQSILLRSDGAFPVLQLPLLGKEPIVQLNGHRQRSKHV